MQITVTSRHYELTAALKDYAEAKIDHLTTYFENIVNAHIVFEMEKYLHVVEVTLHANGKDFVAKDASDDMYASVDGVVEKLERQILKHKGKRFKKKSPKLSAIEVSLPPEESADDGQSEESDVVPADPVDFPALTLGEAASHLRDNGKEFSIFANVETNRLNILFKRDDGKLGLIEAK